MTTPPTPVPAGARNPRDPPGDQRGGFGGANVNSGAAAATGGEYLLILNSDLEIGPRFVADLVEAAAPWQPCVAGGSAMVDPAGHPAPPTARHFPTTTGHQSPSG